MADRYLVVNVSHDNVDFCIIEQDLSSLLMHTYQQGHQTWYILSYKIVVEKAGSEKIFMLVTFLWYINFSVLFL